MSLQSSLEPLSQYFGWQTQKFIHLVCTFADNESKIEAFYDPATMAEFEPLDVTATRIKKILQRGKSEGWLDTDKGIAMLVDEINKIIEKTYADYDYYGTSEISRLDKKIGFALASTLKPEVDDIESARLGKFAFPELRSDFPEEILTIDPNTKFEDEIQNDLMQHFAENDDVIDQKEVDYIKQAIANHWYPSIFKEPQTLEVYRGVALSMEKLQEILGLEQSEIKTGEYLIDKRFRVTRKTIISSWSSDFEIAKNFSTSSANTARVIMTAYTSENRGKFWDTVGLEHEFSDESEIMALDELIHVAKVSILRLPV